MKFKTYSFFLLALSANSQAGLFKSYDWSGWEVKKSFKVYGSEWVIEERTQGVNYSPWHISRWFIWQNYSANSGVEKHLVNKALGFNENILALIVFPQKDGSYKPLLRKPFLDKEGSIDYYGGYGIYEEDGTLKVWLNPSSETGTDRLLPPYTDCGFLTAKEKVAYAADRRHEPEVYYGEFDPKAQKFYMRHVSAPIQYVYWSEWGSITAPFLKNRNQYRRPSVWDATNKKYVPGAPEVRPKYTYLGRVEDEAKFPIVCNPDDLAKAKNIFKAYLKDIWQPAIDKELSMMSEHEKATFKREDCDGVGLNYDFGCKQIDDHSRTDGRKNVFPERIKPPRVKDMTD